MGVRANEVMRILGVVLSVNINKSVRTISTLTTIQHTQNTKEIELCPTWWWSWQWLGCHGRQRYRSPCRSRKTPVNWNWPRFQNTPIQTFLGRLSLIIFRTLADMHLGDNNMDDLKKRVFFTPEDSLYLRRKKTWRVFKVKVVFSWRK